MHSNEPPNLSECCKVDYIDWAFDTLGSDVATALAKRSNYQMVCREPDGHRGDHKWYPLDKELHRFTHDGAPFKCGAGSAS